MALPCMCCTPTANAAPAPSTPPAENTTSTPSYYPPIPTDPRLQLFQLVYEMNPEEAAELMRFIHTIRQEMWMRYPRSQ